MRGVKQMIRGLPLIGALSRIIVPPKTTYHFDDSREFDHSSDYWERRYREGGGSGAGSYNRLARFKADTVNQLIRKHGVRSVIEFGCGDGAQLALAGLPVDYVGVDVSRTIVEACKARFSEYPRYAFVHVSEAGGLTADLSMSLDVIFHLVEDDVFDEYMTNLFAAAGKLVVVYSSNYEEMTNSPHVRHHKFTDWVAKQRPDFGLEEMIPNIYPFDPGDPDHTSFADFYIFRKTDDSAS